jgi:hypothetical protein
LSQLLVRKPEDSDKELVPQEENPDDIDTKLQQAGLTTSEGRGDVW